MRLARLAGGAAAAAALAAALYWAAAHSDLSQILGDGERQQRLIAELGPWGPLAIILTLAGAVVVSPIPSAPIALAAGAAYGSVWGSVYVVAGAEAGALIAFTISRHFGYDAVRRWPRAARLLDGTHSQPALAAIVFASRLLPFLSFDAVSYAAGLTALRWWWFALATLAGVVPVSVALVWSGERMALAGMEWIGPAVLVLGAVTLLPAAARLFRRRGSSPPSDTTPPPEGDGPR